MKILCVLKTGGEFDQEDVVRLQRCLRRAINHEFDLCCLTDGPPVPGTVHIPLVEDFPGWWSKMEMFAIDGPCIYFDLDTIVVRSPDALIDHVEAGGEGLTMLKGFRHDDMTSGVMGWSGDMSWIFHRFMAESRGARFFDRAAALRMKTKAGVVHRGDGEWVCALYKKLGMKASFVQNIQSGVLSYKIHVRTKGDRIVDDQGAIVCFHGTPRPKSVWKRHPWARLAWSK